MAILTAIKNRTQSRTAMKNAMLYAADQAKTVYHGEILCTGVNCNLTNSYIEMLCTKERFNKTDGRMFYQFVQSFAPEDNVTPPEVNRMGVELAEKLFPNYEAVVCTHCNTNQLHNHIIVNSVSFTDGKKLHLNHDDLVLQRQVNDEICVRRGLSVLDKYEKHRPGEAIPAGEYRAALNGDSWKYLLMDMVDECMSKAVSKSDFIELMESEGYQVKWTDTRKNITYTTPDGHRCRDDRLHDDKYLKENMECEFEIRQSDLEFVKDSSRSLDDEYDDDFEDNGWAEERADAYTFVAELIRADPQNQNSVAEDIAYGLLSLAYSLERCTNAPVQDCTTLRPKRKHRRKRAPGQAHDDNSDYDDRTFTMRW